MYKQSEQDYGRQANRRNDNSVSQDEVVHISQSLPIPEYKMGWIIGKRGTYIIQLAKKSGASITISDSKSKEYGTVWKYIQITGSGRAVDRAKKLLHIRLERLEPRNSAQEHDETETKDNGVETDDINYSESLEKENNQTLTESTISATTTATTTNDDDHGLSLVVNQEP